MRTIKLIGAAIFFLGQFCCIETLKAQEWKSVPKEEIEAAVHPELLEEADKYIRFDTSHISIGQLNEDDKPRTVTFRYCNVGNQTVTLTNVVTSCGCTVAGFSRKPLRPGEKDSLSLTFNPQNRPGKVDVEAVVYTDISSRKPLARLFLSGLVTTIDEWSHLPQSMGQLRLSRKQVSFNLEEEERTERIACANSGNKPVRLQALMTPPFLKFHSEPAVLAPGQEGDLVITLETDKIDDSKLLGGHYYLILKGITGKPSERTIEIIIKI